MDVILCDRCIIKMYRDLMRTGLAYHQIFRGQEHCVGKRSRIKTDVLDD